MNFEIFKIFVQNSVGPVLKNQADVRDCERKLILDQILLSQILLYHDNSILKTL
jgi:hypothetical protein